MNLKGPIFPALNGSTRAASDYLVRYAANAGLDKPVSLPTTKREIFFSLKFFLSISQIIAILRSPRTAAE